MERGEWFWGRIEGARAEMHRLIWMKGDAMAGRILRGPFDS